MSRLDVMTYNVRYFGHGTRGLRASDRWIRRVAQGVASLVRAPDILALQEVETRSLRVGLRGDDQLDRFVAALSDAVPGRRYRALYFPAHRYALSTGPALYTTGLAMLVSEDIEVLTDNASDPHRITAVPTASMARIKQSRILAHARVAVEGRELDVFNTHLSLPAFREVGPHRIPRSMGHGSNQLQEVKTVMDRIAELRGSGPSVLMGDLNTAPGTPVYQALVDAGWVDAHAEFTGRTPESLARIGTARFMHLRMHLDHVFSTPDVRWEDFTAHRVDGSGPFAGLSDHAPKRGRLVLPELD